MDNDHGITGELRRYASYAATDRFRQSMLAIADRIDAEHQKAEDEWKAKHGQTWLKGYAECHAELLEGNEIIAADLENCGWVRLPVDADGETIHIGDVMEWCDSGETLTVEGIGSDVLFYIDGENAEWTAARNKRHHRAPAVEGVLRDFGVDIAHALDADPDATVPEATIAKYAAKLRLAGDAK